jgi:uroporphyrinogen decarboxylase
MPQFLEYPVKNKADFQRLLPHLDAALPGRLAPDWAELCAFYNRREFPVGLTLCGAFGHPRNLLGVEGLCLAYYEQPGLVHEILEQWVEFYIRLSSRVWEGIHFDFILIWEDMAYKNGPLISPRLVKEFMLPYYRRVIEHVRGLGCDTIIVDSDGDVKELAPLFIGAGVNVMLPFEVQAGMDVRRFRQQYGKNLAIIGGLDKRALAAGKTATDNELALHLQPMLAQGGYIPCLDHTAPPDVSLANFRYYIERVREMAGS